jgi:hypothetical protein
MEELEMDHQFQSLAAERSHKSSLESTHLIETHKPVKGPKYLHSMNLKTILTLTFNVLRGMLLCNIGTVTTGVHTLVHY